MLDTYGTRPISWYADQAPDDREEYRDEEVEEEAIKWMYFKNKGGLRNDVCDRE